MADFTRKRLVRLLASLPGKPADEGQTVGRLAGVDLSGVDLSGLDLSYLDLTRAKLRGSKLHDAYCFRTVAWGADFTGADLTDASLEEAVLTRADFVGVLFRGATTGAANFAQASFCLADLSGVKLAGCDLQLASFHSAKLDGTEFDGVTLGDNDWTKANLHKCVWRDISWWGGRRGKLPKGQKEESRAGKAAGCGRNILFAGGHPVPVPALGLARDGTRRVADGKNFFNVRQASERWGVGAEALTDMWFAVWADATPEPAEGGAP